MAIGSSNRIAIEVDPEKKQGIYAALKARGLAMREWFIETTQRELLNARPKDSKDE